MDLTAPWGWVNCGPQLLDIREKLCNFERMKLGEILRRDSGSHQVELDRLCKQAQDRLIFLKEDDVPQLLSLRLGGKARVWGILDNQIIWLLWWDPLHEVCPSLKKHT